MHVRTREVLIKQDVRGDLRLSKEERECQYHPRKSNKPLRVRPKTTRLERVFQREWPNDGTLETLHAQHHSSCGGVIRAGSPPGQLRLSGYPSWYTNPTPLGGVVGIQIWLHCGGLSMGWMFVQMFFCGACRGGSSSSPRLALHVVIGRSTSPCGKELPESIRLRWRRVFCGCFAQARHAHLVSTIIVSS